MEAKIKAVVCQGSDFRMIPVVTHTDDGNLGMFDQLNQLLVKRFGENDTLKSCFKSDFYITGLTILEIKFFKVIPLERTEKQMILWKTNE